MSVYYKPGLDVEKIIKAINYDASRMTNTRWIFSTEILSKKFYTRVILKSSSATEQLLNFPSV